VNDPALDDAGRLNRAFRLTTGKLPTAAESKLSLAYVGATTGPAEARAERWAQLVQALFASLDFRYE